MCVTTRHNIYILCVRRFLICFLMYFDDLLMCTGRVAGLTPNMPTTHCSFSTDCHLLRPLKHLRGCVGGCCAPSHTLAAASSCAANMSLRVCACMSRGVSRSMQVVAALCHLCVGVRVCQSVPRAGGKGGINSATNAGAGGRHDNTGMQHITAVVGCCCERGCLLTALPTHTCLGCYRMWLSFFPLTWVPYRVR